MKRIIVRIKDGKVVLETDGYYGTECELRSRVFTEQLGTVEQIEPKPEMFVTLDEEVSQEENNG